RCSPLSRCHRHLPPSPTRRSSDLQVIYYGEVDLIFEMPDPYAESIEKKTARLQGATVHYLFTDFSAEGTLFDLVADENGMRLAKDRKSTRLNSSHVKISYAVFCLK